MSRLYHCSLKIEVREGSEPINSERLKGFLNGRNYHWNQAIINIAVVSLTEVVEAAHPSTPVPSARLPDGPASGSMP